MEVSKATLSALAFLFCASTAAFGADDHHFRSERRERLLSTWPSKSLPSTLESRIFAQPIDHFGALPGQTFNQRYWVDTEYATSPDSAPVIFHICGEGDATEGYFLNDNAIEWAKELGANLVYLEHRYYGASLPFSDLSSEHLQYLTLGNELEDLATFQKWVSTEQGWTGKWVTVGGSYSATISALYRQKHPELVVGALASSAPMISGQGRTQGDASDVRDLSSIDPAVGGGDRPWAYQACTTFGFWEAEGSSVFRPSAWLCGKVFGSAPAVDPTVYNEKYDAPFLSSAAGSPSNILFTYGSEDVWTQLGLSTQVNLNPGITVQVIEGAEHHYDLLAPAASDSATVIAARATFSRLAKGWLQ
jgi:pimeloyl-ACP methyl ester carboxylesterase